MVLFVIKAFVVEAFKKVAFVEKKFVELAFINVVEVANRLAMFVCPANVVIPTKTLFPWKVESLIIALVMYCSVEVPLKMSEYSIRTPLKNEIVEVAEDPPP